MTRWVDGRPAEWVTTTEPRYDDTERELWVALHEYQATICPHCGNPRSVCSDPAQPWYAQRDVCWATAASENARRRFGEKHAKAEPDARGYLPTDGVSVWMSMEDVRPDDAWF